MSAKKTKPDVSWHIPKRKRPIAYSTKGTSDLIGVLSEIFYSIKDVHRAIFYDQEAKETQKAIKEKYRLFVPNYRLFVLARFREPAKIKAFRAIPKCQSIKDF